MVNSSCVEQTKGRSPMDMSSVLFWLGFWSLFVKFFLESIILFESFEALLKVFQLFGCAFLLLRTVVLVIKGSSSGLGLVGVCLGILSYLLSGESVLLTTSLILSAAYEIDFQAIIRSWARAVTVILVSMLCIYVVAGVLGESVGKTWLNIGGISSSRGALLFVHPNYCAAVFFVWAMAMWCRFDVGLEVKILVGGIATSVFFYIAGSRTSAVSLLLFFMFVFILKVWKRRSCRSFSKWAPRFTLGIPLMLFLLTYWISAIWFTGPAFSQTASDFLTGRPALWWAQWNYSGLSIFGHHAFEGIVLIRGTIHDIHTVDGMYASFLFNIGIAGFAWILVLVKRFFAWGGVREPIYVAALLTTFIFGFTEWHAMNAVVCVPLILLAEGLRNAEKGVVDEL